MLLIVDLIPFYQSVREGFHPSFGYKNNIAIREMGPIPVRLAAGNCWISDSASIKETCILWVPGYINTG
jgi:hypothetical protein